jgi:GNAT superfamily N-acetyltransferase
VNLVGPSLRREPECEAVLRSLPMWFGIEEALLMYARDSGLLPTFALEQDARLIGFVSLQEHFPASWEIHCIAIEAAARNAGHGTRLLDHAERWLAERGARFLQVKTIAATSASAAYAQTRAFYAARGYVPLEVFPTLWSPRHPALQLVKPLGADTDVSHRSPHP